MATTPSENMRGGQLLAALRQKVGQTQIELAKRAGVSRSMIAQLESGEERPFTKTSTGTLCCNTSNGGRRTSTSAGLRDHTLWSDA